MLDLVWLQMFNTAVLLTLVVGINLIKNSGTKLLLFLILDKPVNSDVMFNTMERSR